VETKKDMRVKIKSNNYTSNNGNWLDVLSMNESGVKVMVPKFKGCLDFCCTRFALNDIIKIESEKSLIDSCLLNLKVLILKNKPRRY